MKLICEQILKPSGAQPENLVDDETLEDQDAGHYASPPNLTPKRSSHVITSPRQQTPRSEGRVRTTIRKMDGEAFDRRSHWGMRRLQQHPAYTTCDENRFSPWMEDSEVA
ncbi:hypothetical protein M5689_003617 [Euphorbia peplus]|nr:hypothetical protein M5689_003617 [Euphorbia peplus]